MDTTLAVLIDFENIAAGTEKERLGRFDINAIMSRLVDKGRVLIARSYADWGRFSRFKQSLLAANVTMYELTSHGMQDKNRADIAMVVDALELAFTKDYIDTFVIVSGDSDFTPLVLKMRELDKRVIGIGTRSSTSRLLVNACDEFIFYDSIVKAKAARTKTHGRTRKDGTKSRRQWAYDLLVESLAGLQREDPKAPLASIVKNAMRRKSPDFSESELGFSSFARFLEAARDSGYVKLDQDRKAGGYRVDSVDGSVDDDDVEDDDTPNSDGWVDTYLPKGTEAWVEALDEMNLHPLSFPARMQVLQLIEATASERQGKRRKVNIQFLREDVRKRLRKTFPDIPARLIRGIFTALMQAGLLIHKDGTAIRSTSAPFHLETDAVGMNNSLLSFYLAMLEEADADFQNVGKLAELLLGDQNRRRDVETALAWLAQSQLGVGDEAALNDVDLDDLLVATDGPKKAEKSREKAAEPKTPAKTEAPKVEAKKPEAKKAEPKKPVEELDLDLDDALLIEEPTKPEKSDKSEKAETPKKKRTTTRRRKKPPVEETEPEASSEDEDGPRKRTRRRVRKKAGEDDTDPNDLDLDALLSSE